MSITSLLAPYQEALQAYKKESIIINPIALDIAINADNLAHTESKFGGFPFFPEAQKNNYPKDTEGLPMLLAAQINFAETPQLAPFPNEGIFQLFFSANEWYKDYCILYWTPEELANTSIKDFSFLPQASDRFPFKSVHRLEFQSKKEIGAINDINFDFTFDGVSPFTFGESISDADTAEAFNELFYNVDSKIGGYGNFLQDDPRYESAAKRNDLILLQLEEENHIDLFMGIVHILIDPEDLRNKAFDKAWCSMAWT